MQAQELMGAAPTSLVPGGIEYDPLTWGGDAGNGPTVVVSSGAHILRSHDRRVSLGAGNSPCATWLNGLDDTSVLSIRCRSLVPLSGGNADSPFEVQVMGKDQLSIVAPLIFLDSLPAVNDFVWIP